MSRLISDLKQGGVMNTVGHETGRDMGAGSAPFPDGGEGGGKPDLRRELEEAVRKAGGVDRVVEALKSYVEGNEDGDDAESEYEEEMTTCHPVLAKMRRKKGEEYNVGPGAKSFPVYASDDPADERKVGFIHVESGPGYLFVGQMQVDEAERGRGRAFATLKQIVDDYWPGGDVEIGYDVASSTGFAVLKKLERYVTTLREENSPVPVTESPSETTALFDRLAASERVEYIADKLDVPVDYITEKMKGGKVPLLHGTQNVDEVERERVLRANAKIRRAIIFNDVVHHFDTEETYADGPRLYFSSGVGVAKQYAGRFGKVLVVFVRPEELVEDVTDPDDEVYYVRRDVSLKDVIVPD